MKENFLKFHNKSSEKSKKCINKIAFFHLKKFFIFLQGFSHLTFQKIPQSHVHPTIKLFFISFVTKKMEEKNIKR